MKVRMCTVRMLITYMCSNFMDVQKANSGVSQEWLSWKEAKASQKKGEVQRDGKNMHFNAGAASQKMMMELISSASDICMIYGICDCLGKIKQDSASIFLTPRVSETASLEHLLRQRDASQHGHNSAQAAEDNLRRIPNRASTVNSTSGCSS